MVCDRSQWPVTVHQFMTCRQSSFILHTYPHVCSVVTCILEQGILLHCLFVLLAGLRDPSQTIILFNWQPIMDRVYWTLYVCHVRWYVHFWNISLPWLCMSIRKMQRLYWEMQNDATVDEKISWCDSKEWGIYLIDHLI